MKNDGNSILLNEVRLLRRRWKMVGENRLSVQEKQFFYDLQSWLSFP